METQINPKLRIEQLIHAASARAGGQNAMARAIGYTPAEVSQWRHGRPCPIEAQALMADLAGLDPHEVITYAILERHSGTPKGERLETVLGKALHAIAVVGFTYTCAAVLWASDARASLHTMYRSVKRCLHLGEADMQTAINANLS